MVVANKFILIGSKQMIKKTSLILIRMSTLKINKLNKFVNAKLSELQLTSTYLGRVIRKIFAKKIVAESLGHEEQ